ncbi:MAG: cytidine deaminase [Bacteroidota bacterium]|nr:cytidine deaminase [Bacteroidota bacterium]
MIKKISFSYKVYGSVKELNESDQKLMEGSDQILEKAYAIYSGFKVGASALLENGEIMTANNQENMALPSSLCAERVLLYYCRANFPDLVVKKMAVSVKAIDAIIKEPITPCGSCRQVMVEYERNQNSDIPILLKGEVGEIYELNSISDLLPLAFKTDVLKRH